MADAVPYDGKIADYVRKAIRGGVSRTKIFNAVQRYQNAPRSMTTFYKLYREDMDEVQAEIAGKIGNKVVNQALEGDFKSKELYLRTQADWTPKNVEVNVEVDGKDIDESALDKLMGLLGKK